ncbi:hypothetical protein BX600DRAFT_482480 [Xylariales sp. PMI_506]|nr:hypothetical protein BX600DRAFT_482480 [Xylariales sp. PMI_506]
MVEILTEESPKSFACFNCATRKTRCDKERPACAACQRRQLTCIYEDAVAAGSRKRKATEDTNGRLERFERILAQRGLTTEKVTQPESTPASTVESTNIGVLKGRLIVDENKTRYINSTLWREIDNHGLGEIVEDEDLSEAADSASSTTAFPSTSLSRGLLGVTKNILSYHPSVTDSTRLWKIYEENVEPLYKFLHGPSAQNLIATTCRNLSRATPAEQCLLFAIYLLAVFSMNEDACLAEFGQARAQLLSQYDYSIRQALFNAAWLSTSNMSILSSFVMYLSVVRRQTDPRSLWIWTGMGTRLMQRMGIHRDGEGMGLRPYDVELRRRLYWHLVSLDTYAGRISGTSDTGLPQTWDTKLPSNINDNQIHPDMTEAPSLRAGATDMMFSLVRIKLGKLFVVENPNLQSSGPGDSAWHATDKIIGSVENEIESEFLRYCDPVEPVHALTLMTARTAIAASRLRQRMPLVTHQTTGRETERGEFYGLARRIMDADSHTFTSPVLKPFEWYIRASFRWDALICLLVVLARPNFFTPEECEGSWMRVGEFFSHHADVLEARNTLQRTIGRMTLMAWLANPPPNHDLEPEYIANKASAPSRHAENADRNAELNLFTSLEGDSSDDITMFLNNDMFGAGGGWDNWVDGIVQL